MNKCLAHPPKEGRLACVNQAIANCDEDGTQISQDFCLAAGVEVLKQMAKARLRTSPQRMEFKRWRASMTVRCVKKAEPTLGYTDHNGTVSTCEAEAILRSHWISNVRRASPDLIDGPQKNLDDFIKPALAGCLTQHSARRTACVRDLPEACQDWSRQHNPMIENMCVSAELGFLTGIVEEGLRSAAERAAYRTWMARRRAYCERMVDFPEGSQHGPDVHVCEVYGLIRSPWIPARAKL
jgi:hypothetical protein